MPTPVSSMTISTCELTRSRTTWIRPPDGVNFTAFDRRFHNTCWRRLGSPRTRPIVESRIDCTRMCLASAVWRMPSSAVRTTSCSCSGWTSR